MVVEVDWLGHFHFFHFHFHGNPRKKKERTGQGGEGYADAGHGLLVAGVVGVGVSGVALQQRRRRRLARAHGVERTRRRDGHLTGVGLHPSSVIGSSFYGQVQVSTNQIRLYAS